MVSRSILALFAIALLFAVASAVSEEEDVVKVDGLDVVHGALGNMNKWATKATKNILKEFVEFVKKDSEIHKHCIIEIVKTCGKNFLLNRKKFFECAGNYLENKENCYISE